MYRKIEGWARAAMGTDHQDQIEDEGSVPATSQTADKLPGEDSNLG
jgi:hypothetical protein